MSAGDSWDEDNKRLKVEDLSQLSISSPNQSFDVDNLEIELLIVCKNPAAFQQSASFLSRRGWPTTVVGSLAKAIEFITKSKPDFVLVSFNHPNQQVAKLPVILAQTFNLESIGFVEFADAHSTARLAASPLPHKIQGLPSGPNIQRTIRKIILDRYAPTPVDHADTPSAALNDPSADKSVGQSKGGDRKGLVIQSKIESKAKSMVYVKGGDTLGSSHSQVTSTEASQPGDDETIDGGSYKMGRKKARTRLKDINTSAVGDEDLAKKSKKLLEMLEASPSRGESGMIFLPSKADVEIGEEAEDLLQEGRRSSPGFSIMQKGGSSKEFQLEQESKLTKEHKVRQTGPDSRDHLVSQSGKDARSLSARLEKSDQGENLYEQSKGAGPERGGGGAGDANLEREINRSGSLLPRAPQLIMPERKVINFNKKTGKASDEREDPIARMVEDSLSASCSGDQESIVLDQVETVGVIPLESSVVTGYIIVSIPKGLQDQGLSFLKKIQSNLETVAPKGFPVKSDSSFLVTTESYKFKDWMAAEATQSFLAYHDGYEVGVALLQIGGALPNPKATEKNMASINLASISPDLPVNFKAYLHFKENNKYFLYLRNGRRLYTNQKEKLLRNKKQDLYIKEVDVGNFKTYAAASAIQSSTKKYRTSKNSEAA